MSATQTYPSQPRTETGTKAANRLRAAGQVPVTVTRRGQPSRHLALDVKSANHLDAHVVHLCKVTTAEGEITALRAEVRKNCLNDSIEHIDLIEVDAKSEITVAVAIHADARNCPGVKAGGIVEIRMRQVKVVCKASAIPDVLNLNLDEVQITETVPASKIELPAGVRLAVPANAPVLTVVIPRAMKVAEPTAAEAAAAAAGEAKPKEGAAPAAAAGDAKDAKAGEAKKDEKKK
jgi:large subunit ribosomal protein L25